MSEQWTPQDTDFCYDRLGEATRLLGEAHSDIAKHSKRALLDKVTDAKLLLEQIQNQMIELGALR